MKTKALLIVLALCMVVSVFAGCAKAYNYNLDEYIKLGDYSKIPIDLSDINKAIKAKYEEAAKGDKKTDTYSKAEEGIEVEDGDVANIKYVGKVDGKEFYGGSSDKYDLTIGSGTFIDGFEDGLIGATVGQTLDIKVTFPKGYADSNGVDKDGKKTDEVIVLSEKEAVFTVTVNSIKRTTYPAYNDANVDKYFEEYKTVKEFEDAVTEDIKKELAWEAFFNGDKDNDYEGCLVIKYPEKEFKKYYKLNTSDQVIAQINSNAAAMGVTVDTYLGYMGYTGGWTGYFKMIADSVKQTIKQELIIHSMLKKVPPLVIKNDEEYEAEAKKLWEEAVEDSGYEGTFKQFKKDYDREAIEMSIYQDRIIDYLLKSIEVTDDVTKQGLITDKKGTKYYIDDVMQTGWQSVDLDGDDKADKCYFDVETGYLAVNGAYAIPEDATEGSTDKLFYKFSDKGVFDGIYNGFYKDGQTIRYFVEGEPHKSGWFDIDGDTYYFYDTTYAATGDVMVKNDAGEDILGRFDKDGKFQMELIGWVETEDGVRYYYKKNDGTVTFATREHVINGITFYFGGKDGYMAVPEKGEFVNGDEFGAIYEKMYLFYKVEIDGAARYAIKTTFTGIYETEGESYYFIEGIGQFGWQKIEGATYFFSSKDGKMLKGEQKISDVTYNFGTDGKLTSTLNGLVYDDASNLLYFVDGTAQTGLREVTVDGKTNKYFFGADGFAVLGWIDVDNDGIKDYYARDYKIVVDQTATIDGVTYKFDAEGKFTVDDSAN